MSSKPPSESGASAEPRAFDSSDLALRAAHELRGSLGAVANWVHLLSNGSHDKALLQQGLAAIQRALKTGTHILDEMADLALLRRGRLALRTGLVDLSYVVDAAVEDLRSLAEEKGIAVEVEREVNSLPVMGDPQRLQQMVHHLLSNAVTYTPAGGVVRVGLRRDADRWVLTVHDSGPGLGPEALARAFEGAARDPRPRGAGSLGVGLALVRHLAVLHGGEVDAASDGPGRGTCFTLRLPIPALIPSPDAAGSRNDGTTPVVPPA
jgi:signal transduction histidine kinase